MPPAWHAVITAKLAFAPDPALLGAARQRLATALEELESIFPLQPNGLFTQVAYGLSYFKRYLPDELVERHMPRAIEGGQAGRAAIIDAIRFPKDPPDTVLEQNDICFHFKSDYRDHITAAIRALFYPGENYLNGIPVEAINVADLFRLTSIRRGFLGKNLPKIIGTRERIPGADKIPDGAMLFMGFTSSHVHDLAQGNLPSFETIPGYTDATPSGYFAGGTAMHLSHILIDLEAWYRLDHSGRLHRMFNPRRAEGPEVPSPSQAPDTSTFKDELERDAQSYKVIEHNAQMQHLSRVGNEAITVYGEKLTRGTVIFLRQDFDTIENLLSIGRTAPYQRCRGPEFISLEWRRLLKSSSRCGAKWIRSNSSSDTGCQTRMWVSRSFYRRVTGKTSFCLRATIGRFLWRSCERRALLNEGQIMETQEVSQSRAAEKLIPSIFPGHSWPGAVVSR